MTTLELELGWGRMHLQEQQGRGPLVLFLHGTGLDSDCWRETWERLPDDCWMLACDFRAHGRSSVPGAAFVVADLLADIQALLASRGSPDCVVVGHSLGGMLASAMIHDLPTCRGLLLVEGWTSLAASAAFSEGRYYAGLADDVREAIAAQSDATRGRVPPAQWATFWQTVSAIDNVDALARWPGPVIHQYGAAGRHAGTEAALCLPRTAASRLEWVEGIGHFAPWLRPDTIADACRELLAINGAR